MFHGACKAHGHTVTQVITALIHLADVEAVLRIAAQNDSTSDLMEEAIYAFEKSTHFVTLLNSVNIVSWIPVLLEGERSDELTSANLRDLQCLTASLHLDLPLACLY